MRVAPDTGAVLNLEGYGVSRGIVIGRAVLMGAAALEVAHYHVPPEAIEAERGRLVAAIRETRKELDALIATLPADAPRELAALLTVHGLLLDDPLLLDDTTRLVTERRYNAEWALATQGQVLAEQFAQMDDAYLRERGIDVQQVIERVLTRLSGSAALVPAWLPQASDLPLVVVARDIPPADMLRLREGAFGGFLTDLGGPASHMAILARSMDVPAIVGLGNACALLRDGDLLVVDGEQGAVLVNPGPALLDEFRQRQQKEQARRERLAALRDAPAVTLDGQAITLEANIEMPEEVDAVRAAGATGIGLFRTEFLFMGAAGLPDEDTQYRAYRQVLQAMQGAPVTIRTLDVGADKPLDGQGSSTNPALGLRAIRYCLAHPELFGAQLRALLRAGVHGQLRIMLPMISTWSEVQAARQALAAASRDLTQRGVSHATDYALGAMVETPAMAVAIEPYVEALDFLSVGTNDLVQYTLAVDRGDASVSDLYDPMHPAVLRLLGQVIDAGRRGGCPVSVCGEMAGDPRATRVLLGLGLRRFSMHPRQLLDVKDVILSADTQALQATLAVPLSRGLPLAPSLLA